MSAGTKLSTCSFWLEVNGMIDSHATEYYLLPPFKITRSSGSFACRLLKNSSKTSAKTSRENARNYSVKIDSNAVDVSKKTLEVNLDNDSDAIKKR